MRAVHRHLPLLGILMGPVPLTMDLVLSGSTLAHASAPSYPLYGTLAVAALFLTYWLLLQRGKARPPLIEPTLWAAIGLSSLTGAFGLSCLSGYTRTELHDGQTYALMPDVLAAVAVSALQLLLAATVLWTHRDGRRTQQRVLALTVVVVMLSGIGAVTEYRVRSSLPPSEHVATGEEPASPDFPTRVEGAVQNLDIPEDTVLGLGQIASGALLRLSDGVMAVDPVTGDELWRHRQPGAEAHTWVSPDMETVVTELVPPAMSEEPEPPTTRVTLDAGSGRVLHSVEDHQRLLGQEVPSTAGEKPPFEGEEVIVRTGNSPVLRAFGVSSGALLWTFDESPACTPDLSLNEPVSSTAVTREHVFVLLRCLGPDGDPSPDATVLHALEASTGQLLWTHAVEDRDEAVAGIVTASPDGSLLYKYEPYLRTYFAIDAATGDVVRTGTWEGTLPIEGVWGSVLGEGVLLTSLETDTTLSLTDRHGSPTRTLELPPLDEEEASRKTETTDSELYTLQWPQDAGPAVLTAYPWDGSAPRDFANVLGRELSPDEEAGMRVVPGAVIVYAQASGVVTSAVAIT